MNDQLRVPIHLGVPELEIRVDSAHSNLQWLLLTLHFTPQVYPLVATDDEKRRIVLEAVRPCPSPLPCLPWSPSPRPQLQLNVLEETKGQRGTEKDRLTELTCLIQSVFVFGDSNIAAFSKKVRITPTLPATSLSMEVRASAPGRSAR